IVISRRSCVSFFSNDPASTALYTLSLHDALPILLPYGEVLGAPLLQAVKHIVHGVFEGFVVLPDFHAVYHFYQRIHVAFFLRPRSEEHTSELQSRFDLVCRLLLEKKKHTRLYIFK